MQRKDNRDKRFYLFVVEKKGKEMTAQRMIMRGYRQTEGNERGAQKKLMKEKSRQNTGDERK